MNSVTHIAGPPITANGRLIQRCSFCGEKLVDSNGAHVPVNPDGTVDSIGTWEMGRLVRVTAGNPTHYQLLPMEFEDGRHSLPEDACIDLVE